MNRRQFALGVLVAAGATGVAGCVGQTNPDLTPAQIIEQASQKLAATKSAHFELTSTGGKMAIGNGLAASKIVGDVVQPDRLRGTATSTFGKLSIEIQFVIVGTREFITNPVNQHWVQVPTPVAPPNLLDPTSGAPAILKTVKNLKKLPNETIAGRSTYHLQGDVNGNLIAALVGSVGNGAELHGDIWVDAKDLLVEQLHLIGPIAKNEPPAIARTLKLSNYNAAVTINPPI